LGSVKYVRMIFIQDEQISQSMNKQLLFIQSIHRESKGNGGMQEIPSSESNIC